MYTQLVAALSLVPFSLWSAALVTTQPLHSNQSSSGKLWQDTMGESQVI